MTRSLWLIACLWLWGCATCRDVAVNNAHSLKDKGEVRIAAYCLGFGGHILGMGTWSSHVQAQVKKDKWMWVDTAGDVSDKTEFSSHPMGVDGKEYDYIWWTLPTYEGMLERKSEILSDAKNPCDHF